LKLQKQNFNLNRIEAECIIPSAANNHPEFKSFRTSPRTNIGLR